VDRRLVFLAAFAGLVAMVAAWFALGTPNRGRARERLARPTVAAPVRIDAEDLSRVRPGAQLRPDLADKLRITKHDAPPPPPAAAPEAGEDAPFPLDQDGIAAAVRARTDDLRACYETARFHTPGLAGKMTLTFAVVPDEGAGTGHVASVDVETDLDTTVFEGCVVTVFEELRFATTEPTTVRYPVAFAEETEEEAP
jgi:hypothetical protein